MLPVLIYCGKIFQKLINCGKNTAFENKKKKNELIAKCGKPKKLINLPHVML
jgi:hypothetical protein